MENETPKPEVKENTFAHIDNIKKEIITTIVGVVLMGASLIDALSAWDMPSIDGVERKYQLVLVFIIGFGHLFLRDTLIDVIKGVIIGFKDLIMGFFTKKKE